MLPSMGADHGEPFSPTKIHPLLSPQRESFSASGVKSAVDTRLLNLNDAHHPRSSSPSATLPSQPTPTPTPTPSSTPINNEHSQAQLSPSPNVDHQSLSIVTTEDANSVVTHDVSGTAPASGLPADPPPNGPIRTDTQLTSSSKSSSIENLTLLPPKASFRENRNRKHRKGAHSIDSIPRQTILKALQSRPNGSRKMSVSNSMDAMVMDSENSKAVAPKTTASGSFAHARLAEALSELDLDSSEMSVSKMAALASPCFYHKKFDKAVNIEKVLDEMAEDDTISHSRLMQTATSVREIAKQLQRRPIKMAVRNIMIVTKARDNELVHLTRQLAEWLLCTPRYGSDVGVNVYVDHKLRKSKRFDMPSLLAKDERFHDMLRFWTPELCWTSPEKFDLVLTLGGDGTVLFTSWLFQRIVPPIVSFSLGSLGFLTNFEFAQHQNALNKIMGDAGMRVNLRMRFTCTVYRYQKHAAPGAPQHIEAEQFEVLNELVIDRGPSPYVSQLELYGDNNLLTVVQADGCIFSTPTGSTAYSLSAGGSLVHPDIPAILLTPICPHTLSFRPMLLNDSMLLRVAVPRNSRATAYCAFDGKGRVELRQGDHVTIAASQYPFPTVLSQPTEWFDSLSRTLRWNNRGAQQKAWDGDEKEDEDGTTKDTGFDIDFDNDEADRDSGYSAEGSITGDRESPIRKGIVLPFP